MATLCQPTMAAVASVHGSDNCFTRNKIQKLYELFGLFLNIFFSKIASYDLQYTN